MIDNKDVSAVCTAAADLIEHDGWMPGGQGWRGIGGWCLEGALGKVMGRSVGWGDSTGTLSGFVNRSPAGVAIKKHLGECFGPLCHWNDTQQWYGNKEGRERVVHLLRTVAAEWRKKPADFESSAISAQAYDLMAQQPVTTATFTTDGVVYLQPVLFHVDTTHYAVEPTEPVLDPGELPDDLPEVPDFVPEEFVDDVLQPV